MSEATEETLTPPERLALADLSFDDLLAKVKEIDEGIEAAKRVLEEGKQRKAALAAERKERETERHREARENLACPHCGAKELSNFRLISPEGYIVHDLEDHEDGCRLLISEGEVEYCNTVFVVKDGVVQELKAENVLACKCGGAMPIPKNLTLDWV